MKRIGFIGIVSMILLSCNPQKTVYISNKTGSPISLRVDSSYQNNHSIGFINAINGLRIEKKKVFDFGKGKWTKEDKSSLEELMRYTRIVKDGSSTAIDMPSKTKVSHIRFNVEEIWLNIK